MRKLLMVLFFIGLCFTQARDVVNAGDIVLSWPVQYLGRTINQGYHATHLALDIVTTAVEKPIFAAEGGEVLKVGWMAGLYGCGETVSEEDWVAKGRPGGTNCGGYQIRIRHGVAGDYYYTGYYHLQSNIQVAVGDSVAKAQRIGTMGDTGWAFGVHLHFVLNKNAGSILTDTLNPALYLVEEPGGVDPPGVKSLVQSEFTVERTNPSLSEEVWFSTKLENNGEVNVYIDTVFLRLTRGSNKVEVYGWKPELGIVTLAPGASRVFDLRAPPISEAGLWRIQKVEVGDTANAWFELGFINSHLMVGYQNLIKDHYAVASSEQPGSGNGPQKANDGNMRSRWESKRSDSQWIEFDLDSTQIVDTVIVRSEAAFPLWFDVLIQEEGKSEWILVVEDLRGLPENSTYISFSPHSVRKIKFEFKERGTDWGHSIREIEVYNLSAMGGPQPTSTPLACGPGPVRLANPVDCGEPTATATFTSVPTSTPIPTVTTEPTNIPDTTPPEGYITSPTDGAFLGTGWFNATAYATDSGSGVKKVEFHFWHDGAWYIIEDRNGDDGWSASFDLTGLWAQNDMKMLLHLEDNADNRIQSNVVSGLTNVLVMATSTATATPTLRSTPTATWTATLQPTNTKTPTATHTPTPLVTDPMSGVIEGTIVDETGTPVRGVDVQLWRDTQPSVYWVKWVEDGTYQFDGLPYSTWTIQIEDVSGNNMWEEVEPQVVVINEDTSIQHVDFILTKTPIPTNSPTPTVVWTNTATPVSVPTLTATGTPVPTSTLTPTPTPSSTLTPTPTVITDPTLTPTPSVTDPMSGVIAGTIVDETGVFVRGVDVQLWRDTQSSVYWVVWVENGTYRFDGLPYSTWTLKVEDVSGNNMWEEVEPQIVVISEGQKEQTVNFVLTKKQSPVFKVFVPLVRR